ncbi:hypothetical protein [Oryzibacter oryziterrae]|uniref:hypothetical protein n=1 Tax=Oryzibacter oryziterrae TaxID=2766474 RepID=UPI001F476C99|nr:hypothetical protein [Oryzibacter oryziterrae]
MKKLILALALATTVVAPAYAGGLTIANHSGADWDEIEFSKPGAADFSVNLLDGAPDKSFENGMTYASPKEVAAGNYDVRIYDDEDPNSECILKDVSTDGKTFEFTADLKAKFCKS